MLRSFSVALLVLATFAEGGRSQSARPQHSAGKGPDAVREVRRLLLKLEDPTAPGVQDLARSLARLGPAGSEEIVAIYVGAAEPPHPPENSPTPAVDPFAEVERPRLEDVLLAALKLLPPGEVVAGVRVRAMGEVAQPVRMNGVRALGEVGTARALEAWFETLQELSDFERAQFGVQETASAALAAILASDEHCWRELSRRMQKVAPGLEGILVHGLSRAGSVRGFSALVDLLGRPETEKARLLEAIGGLAERAAPWVEEADCAPIRVLLDADDPEIQRSTAVVLGQLNDIPSVPKLICSLDSEDGRVKQGALWALERMSGLSLPADGSRWHSWHEDETKWFDVVVHALRRKLEKEDPAGAFEAIAEMSQHPLYRHRLAEDLARPLAHGSARIARAACAGLGQLGSARAITPLVESLLRPEEDVRQAARDALVAITGRDLPAQYDEWANQARP